MVAKRFALVVLVAAAVLVATNSASAAQQRARVRLALIPLQTAQLGPASASWALNYPSGPLEDNETNFFGIHIYTSSSPGPIGGYALDYGDPLTGSAGVMEIRSAVEEFQSRRDARFALIDSRFQDQDLAQFGSPVLPITETKVKAVAIGQGSFADLITLAAPGLNPIVRLHETVAAGKFALDLTILAGSASAAERSAPHLLRLLHHRLNRALQGHLAGSPPALPHEPQPGQAPGGPDLSTLILHPQDVGQSHAINLFQGYSADPPALSEFFMELAPAGTYDLLLQQIGWWPTATEATYGETYDGGVEVGFLAQGGTITPVDLSAVGDPATGYLITGGSGGGTAVFVTLTNGQAGEFVFGESKSTLQSSDAQSLAQAAAGRLDAGLGP